MSDNKPRQHQGYPKEVRIVCPECKLEQDAAIDFYEDDPFPIYVHVCSRCDHGILESEWSEAEPPPQEESVISKEQALELAEYLDGLVARLEHAYASDPRLWEKVKQIRNIILSSCPSPEDREAVKHINAALRDEYGIWCGTTEALKALAHIRRRLGMEGK